MDKILRWQEEAECGTCGGPLYIGDPVIYHDGDPYCCRRCVDVAQHTQVVSAAYREYLADPAMKIQAVIDAAKAFRYTSETEGHP